MAGKSSSSRANTHLRIGISGWTYAPWRNGAFFPKKWPHRRELEFASREVNSIEINGTFYSLQRPASFRAWHEATPDDFVFSVKGGRFITHLKRLKNVETPLANFFASGVLELGEKLGPILWQLPPSFRYDPERLERFFRLLPHTKQEAAALARLHDERMKGRASTRAKTEGRLRHAMEVRHESFQNEEFIRLLRKHQIGLVVAETAGKWPHMEDVTANFVYVRLHGDEELYVSGYTKEALDAWAKKIRAWSRGRSPRTARRVTSVAPRPLSHRDVFVYFDNDVKVRAPHDAMTLAHKLGLSKKPGAPPAAAEIAEVARRGWPAVRRRVGRK
ncbi:MAG TPA: DUF72 domain-containing protein [Chthoniobacteraceae bacterium]